MVFEDDAFAGAEVVGTEVVGTEVVGAEVVGGSSDTNNTFLPQSAQRLIENLWDK